MSRCVKRLLVVGCGYLGRALAQLALERGLEVGVVTASAGSAKELGESFPSRVGDIADPASVDALGRWWRDEGAVVSCVSSGGGGVEAYRRVYLEGMRQLSRVFPRSRRVFTSSTSVYAQTNGLWVDETSPALPASETGKILRETEEHVLSSGGVVARFAGIYGPGRCALLRRFLDGSARMDGEGEKAVNMIHRDDGARALLRLCDSGLSPGLFNVADNAPLTQREIYMALSGHFAKPLPPSSEPDLKRKRGWTNKRVSNAKLRSTGWIPEFSSFTEALVQDPLLKEI